MESESPLLKYHLKLEWLVALALAAFLLDIRTNDCIKNKTYKSPSIFGVLFVHHLLNTFANFGWLLDNPLLLKLYIIAPVITLIHWSTNKNQCVVSQWANELCGEPENAYFRDLFYMIGLKDMKYYSQFHYSYLVLSIILAIYKLRLLKQF